MKGWATATVTPLFLMMEKLGRSSFGTSTCEQCLYKCNTEIPKSDNNGREVASLDELYNGVKGNAGSCSYQRVLKGCSRLAVFQPPSKVYQRQQQRISTGIQPVIARIGWSAAARSDVGMQRRGWEWMRKVMIFLAQPWTLGCGGGWAVNNEAGEVDPLFATALLRHPPPVTLAEFPLWKSPWTFVLHN